MLCDKLVSRSAKLGCGKSKTDSPVHNNSNNLVKDNGKMAGNSLFPAANSQQRLGTGASSPLARSKIALKPGRSLMDWIRLGRSNKDLTGVGGEVLNVSVEELSKHDKADDAWIAIRGRVYNISPYLEYHPGGVDELMRGAGVDATQLFDEIHKWVNAESMLEKCYVGKLETESPASVKVTGSRSMV
ncbi:Cytochrome b5 reductase 4 [Nucella lapillus]